MHKDPFKFRFIAGSRQCTTKPLSQLLTIALQKIKEDRERYCEVIYRRTGVNMMWILKNSGSLLDKLKKENINKATHISTWDFSTLYTTIPQNELKSRMKKLIYSSFPADMHYINISPFRTYFSQQPSTNKNYTSWTNYQFYDAFEFLIDNIYIKFGDDIFQQTLGIPMGTDCAPVVADLFLHTYEFDFLNNLIKRKKFSLAKKFSLIFRYIDDLICINNEDFEKYISKIYTTDHLELKETTEGDREASYLDLMVSITPDGRLEFRLYDKRDQFNFYIVNFPYMDSNIPVKPAYGVYNSQLVRYARACTHYKDFLTRHRLLVMKLTKQGYQDKFLKRNFISFYNKHQTLVSKYDVDVAVHIKEGIYNLFKQSSVSDSSKKITSSASVVQSSRHTSPSDTPWVPVGLRNLGMSCYLNAVLQCIFKCETITSFLRWSKNSTSDRIIVSILELMKGATDIADFHDLLITADEFFDHLGIQQDAHEALLKFLEVLHIRTIINQSEDLGLSQPLSQSSQTTTSAVKLAFQGSYRVTSECSLCQKCNTFVETFQEIPINYNNDVCCGIRNSLAEKVHKLCQGCSRDAPHCIKRSVWQQPKVTIVRINRFKQMSSGRISKNHNKVCVSELLSFDGYKGKLIGVISHIGSSLSSGHYVSYVRIDSTWYRCSDEQITEPAFSEFCDSGESYILFYQKV